MASHVLSVGQATFFLSYGWTLCLWIASEYITWQRSRRPIAASHDEDDEEDPKSHLLRGTPMNGNDATWLGRRGTRNDTEAVAATAASSGGAVSNGEGVHAATSGPVAEKAPPAAAEPSSGGSSGSGHTLGPGITLTESCMGSALVRCLMMDIEAIVKHRLVLRSMAEFGSLMFWYFLADRTPVIAYGAKDYSRDLFIFLFVILTSVAFGCSLQTFKSPVLLNRPQTEEWKGWMQVLFLLYHYYEAKEVYNAIRIFIAGYVWMTGYGNFSYYYKTGDFSIGRFAQMLWRLNFLVFFACIVLRNSYMLYYICPMHTIFTVMVYACLAIAPKLNASNTWIWIKLVLSVVVVFLLWDVRRVFYAMWTPFLWLVGYTDPRKPPGQDPMYEWYFRSGLDRYVWIYGMLCAFIHPQASAILKLIDELPVLTRAMWRTAILTACTIVGYFWYVHVYCLPKVEYNAVHPYTSWIPITIFIIVRNMTPSLRLHHLRLYGWLGCITLETYISQFHVWMKTRVPDGQPKDLLVLIPEYPLLNFAAVTALYVFVSHRLFELTNSLKNAAVPHSNNALLARNTVMLAAVGLALYCVTWALMNGIVYRI